MKPIRARKMWNAARLLSGVLGVWLLAGTALRADVVLTDRQAVEKEARKKQAQALRKEERARHAASGRTVDPFVSSGEHALVDGSGLEWFINSDITYNTSSSASGAASEASYTHAVAATTQLGGNTSMTLNDMFDGYNSIALSFDGSTGPVSTGDPSYVIYNENGVGATECSGRQVVLNPQVMNNIRVQRKVYVPNGDEFCRWLNILTNQDTVSRTFNLVTCNNLGSDSSTIIVTSSDGDAAAEASDLWVTTMQNYVSGRSPDPRIGHVLQGAGAPVGLTGVHFANGDDNPYWSYRLTLAPGETAIILQLATGQPSKAAAAAKADELATLPAAALECMTPTEITQVRNFVTSGYSVRFRAGANGAVTGRLNQVVVAGGNTSPVTAVADDGYIFSDWTGTGRFRSSENPLVVRHVQQSLDIWANFANRPPEVAIISPANGAAVSGLVGVQVEASDADGIAGVTLTADGKPLGAPRAGGRLAAPAPGLVQGTYSFIWDTTLLANGSHRLEATATDNAGMSSSVAHTVTVDNAVLALQAARLEERTWTMAREYAQLTIGVSHAPAAVSRYAVQRRSGGGGFAAVKEFAAAELTAGTITWNDGYLQKATPYTYRVVALNAAGAVIGASPEVTL